MKKYASIIVLLTLTSCAYVQETRSADGEKAYAINCSGQGFGWEECFVAAGKQCGDRGYKVLDRSSEDAASISGNPQGFHGSQSTDRSMLIACK